MNIDLFIFQSINQLAFKCFWLDFLAIFFAEYFQYVLIFFLLIFLLKNFKKYWSMVFLAFFSAVFSRFVIVEIIRYFLPRARPFVENSVNLLINHLKAPSFPSGHAAFYFALATIVFLYLKKVYPVRKELSNGVYPRPKFWWGAGLLFFFASFLISISRVFCGIHWPSDILIGAVVGVLSAFLIFYSFRKFSLFKKS